MGKVNVRKETGKLYLDFRYLGLRCREQTNLPDTSSNRKKCEALLKRIEAQITLETFDYAKCFPGSKNIERIRQQLSEQGKIRRSDGTRRPELDTPTFEEFAELWFREMQVQWRASHIRNVRSIIDSSLFPWFGNRSLDRITKADIMEFRSREAEKPGRNGEPHLTAKTLNNRMGVLRLILTEASDRYGFENPYRNIKPLKLKRTHIEPFSLAEVNKILAKVRPDYRNYFAVRFFTGMRSGEIHGLKWQYVDFSSRLILVRETLIKGRTEYTKTDGSQRDIPMLGPVHEALLAQHAATAHLSEYVFCNKSGQPLDTDNVTKRVWYPLLRHLGLKKRRPYQTRHTAATLLLASGENPEWVAHVLGHSSTEMLFKVYSRYIPNLTRQDGSAFEQLVKGHVLPEETHDHDAS